TCAASGGIAPYTWSIAEGNVPGGFTNPIPSTASVNVGNSLYGGDYRFTIKVTDSTIPIGSVVSSYTLSGSVPPPPPQITCSNTSAPQKTGVPYISICVPVVGTPPYHWSLSGGAIPDGLSLTNSSAGGVAISGTPTTVGSFSFTLQVTDANNAT